MSNNIHVGFRAPLNEKDSADETFGCRANNPDICKFNGTDFCAFCNCEHICRKPPKTWPKQYENLKNQEKKK